MIIAGIRRWLIAAALALTLIAGAWRLFAPAGAASLPIDFEGTRWRLLSSIGDEADWDQQMDEPLVRTLRFQNGQYSAGLGCNTARGDYAANGLAIEFAGRLTTVAACIGRGAVPYDPPGSNEYTRLLLTTASYRHEAGILILLDGRGREVLRFQRD